MNVIDKTQPVSAIREIEYEIFETKEEQKLIESNLSRIECEIVESISEDDKQRLKIEKDNLKLELTQIRSIYNELLHTRTILLDEPCLSELLDEVKAKRRHGELKLAQERCAPVVSHFDALSQHSSSTIAEFRRSDYDPFHFPCSSNTYIPNMRLRNLRDSIQSGVFEVGVVEECELRLLETLLSLQSWGYPEGGSKSTLLDPHVNRVILDEIMRHTKTSHNTSLSLRKDALPFRTVLCKSAKSEYRLDFKTHGQDFVLFATECKGVDASHFDCLIQALEITADSALHMNRATSLNSSDCAVPGLIVYADIIRFFGVYLIDDFPVVVFLTPALTYTNVDDRRIIARAISACVRFIYDSTQLLSAAQVTPDRPPQFALDNFFFKPIRRVQDAVKESTLSLSTVSNVFSSFEKLMYIYGKIASVEECAKYILFPLGLMRIPSVDTTNAFATVKERVRHIFPHVDLHLASLIVFPYLPGDIWKNGRPPKSHEEQYIELLTLAVEVLNTASVAHMDLYTSNIMWRILSESTIEIKIIDFEDAVMFGSKVMFVKALQRDVRYPIMNTRELQFASKYHNMWYLVSITAWLRESEADITFSEYMRIHYYDIGQAVLKNHHI